MDNRSQMATSSSQPAAEAPRPTVRISDIARECGLSSMTVSRAIRNTYGVDPRTRQKVLATAERLGYVRNKIASNLVQQRTQTIGVVLPDIERSIFPAVLKGIESAVSPQGYGILLSCSEDDLEREQAMVQALLEQQVDGIILAPSSMKSSALVIERIRKQKRPLVLVDRMTPAFEGDAVTVDDEIGAYTATRHLIENGYRRILHLGGPQTVWTAVERERGFRRAMTDARRKIDASTIVHTGLTVDDGMQAMEKVLNGRTRPDAIFCWNDPVAMGVYKTLVRRGIVAGEEIGLVGFSDTLEAEIMGVPLTTVAQHPRQIGFHAGRLLMNRLGGGPGEKPAEHCIVKTELIVRASSVRSSSVRSESKK
jgi:LacI family transcriptional regulator